MSVKPRSLGRGLDALLPKLDKVSGDGDEGVKEIVIESLQVSSYQPRKYLNPEAMAELVSSVAEKGILQPLLVRPDGDSYEIVAGERRFRAAQQAGLSKVPVVIRELSNLEALEIAIIENLQRENLNPVEEARAFKQLMELGRNQEEVAKAIGKSRSSVANTLRLLNLSEEALSALERGEISAGHARAILSQDEEHQDWALAEILSRDLSVREAERLEFSAEDSEDKPSKAAKKKEKHYGHLEEELARHVGTKVNISGKDKGKLVLHFHSSDELQRLLELIGYSA